ncbi:hypothetical protein LCGC14_3158440, partial [marine sediment metagenome]
LTYTRNRAKDQIDNQHPAAGWFDPFEAATYRNTINRETFLITWPPHTVLVRDISAVYTREIVNYLLVEYYRVTYTLLFNPGPTGWDFSLVNHGNEAMQDAGIFGDPGAFLRRAAIHDENGNQIVKLLTTDGQEAADQNPDVLPFLAFQPKEEKSFGALGITF